MNKITNDGIFARFGGFRKKTVLPKGNTLIFQICTIHNYYSLKINFRIMTN